MQVGKSALIEPSKLGLGWESQLVGPVQATADSQELGVSLGAHYLKAKPHGPMNVTRKKNSIVLTGRIIAGTNDTYDFDPMQPAYFDAKVLENAGLAKEFPIQSQADLPFTLTCPIVRADDGSETYGKGRITWRGLSDRPGEMIISRDTGACVRKR